MGFHQLLGAAWERSTMNQDSASAPTPHPHGPCPYTRGIWHPILGGTQKWKMLTFEGGHLFFLMKERQKFLDAVAELVK